MMKRIEILGVMDGRKNTVLEQISRVYSGGASSPTLSTMAGGNRQPKTLRKWKMQRKRTCDNCKWCYKEEVNGDIDRICVNGYSDHVSDYVEADDTCMLFEMKGGEKDG